MRKHRTTILFLAANCLVAAAVVLGIRAFGLESEADATIRFFFFEHRDASVVGALALYVGTLTLVIVTEHSGAIKSFIRRAARGGHRLAA